MYGRWVGYVSLLRDGDKQKLFDVPRDWNWRPKVTFMIPSFNEGQVVVGCIESIMASDYPKELIEIMAVDDCSLDDTWDWLQKMHDKYPDNVIVWKNNPNKGKPFTLIDIVKKAAGEIVFTVDSDTVIAPNAIKECVSCYADPDIGVVGGQVRVKNLNESLLTQMVGMLYVRLFYIYKVMENQFLTSRCVCGPLASFRTSVFRECIPIIEGREFLGVKPIRAGEDTYITTRIALGTGLTQQWKIFCNFQALAWTDNPSTFKPFLYQQLRWWRGGLLNGTFVIFNLRKSFMNGGVMPTILTSLTAAFVTMSFASLPFFWMSGALPDILLTSLIGATLWGIGSCYSYNWFLGRHDKIGGKIKNPIMTGALYGAWTMASWLILSPIAMFTMDDGGWVTRQNGETNNVK
jgi:hyaluronan synthase